MRMIGLVLFVIFFSNSLLGNESIIKCVTEDLSRNIRIKIVRTSIDDVIVSFNKQPWGTDKVLDYRVIDVLMNSLGRTRAVSQQLRLGEIVEGKYILEFRRRILKELESNFTMDFKIGDNFGFNNSRDMAFGKYTSITARCSRVGR